MFLYNVFDRVQLSTKFKDQLTNKIVSNLIEGVIISMIKSRVDITTIVMFEKKKQLKIPRGQIKSRK